MLMLSARKLNHNMIFEVPLNYFLARESRQTHSRVFHGKERFFYAYPYGAYFIWGATAGMLSNLAEVLRDQGMTAP